MRALIRGLPLDSAFWHELAPQASRWTTTEELLASLLEMTDSGWRLFARANGSKSVGTSLKIPRPTDAPDAPRRGGSFRELFRSLRG